MCDDARHRVLVPDWTGGKLITHKKKNSFLFLKKKQKIKKTLEKKNKNQITYQDVIWAISGLSMGYGYWVGAKEYIDGRGRPTWNENSNKHNQTQKVENKKQN